ncbi:hypothetical protein C2E23DRAFT_735317 [Lenzites betulinus]|nr:hypothetical protein C2E23DRAFT_735317 [Lenzites betulinus]
MPTVPSTCVPLDSLIPMQGVSPLSDERTSGPTPDPDNDDLILVSVDQGNAVSNDSAHGLPQATLKPRIDLGTINLHSPSSIVGTPFEISPRFEYPFPPASCTPPFQSIFDFDPVVQSFPALANHVAGLPSGAPSMPSAVSLSAMSVILPGRTRGGEPRSFSPTHLKLQARDPPVPPSLVKKRKLTQAGAGDDAAKRAPMNRLRSGSLSDLSLHLAIQEGRGRDTSSEEERGDIDRDRSHSLDAARRKCSPLERHPSDVTVVDPEDCPAGEKPVLLRASSSKTLLSEPELPEKATAGPTRSSSLPPTSPSHSS